MLRHRTRSWTCVAGLALLTLIPGSPGIAAPKASHTATVAEDHVIYQVKRGDNLFTLAERYFDRLASIDRVMRLNRIRNPRRVPVGTMLRLPTSILRAEPLTARVVAVRGTVRIHRGNQLIIPKEGSELPPGTTIETGADGFITLALPNGSRTSLPTLSRLSITRLHRLLLTGSIDYDFTVEAGKAETRAAPLDSGNGLFRIRTPRAVAAVRGTQFRVGYEGSTSLAEVVEGTVSAAQGGGTSEDLAQGFGAVIADGKLSREALLAAPDLLAPGKVQVDPQVQLTFRPVLGAGGYHVQIGTDGGFADVIAEARSNVPEFKLESIPNGGLFVRASAISVSGLEGMPETWSMRRALTGLGGSGAVDFDRLSFKWGGAGEGRRLYRFQLVRDSADGTPVVDEPGLEEVGIALRALEPGTYYWRVGVRQFSQDGATENWLPFEKIIVSPQEG